MYLKDSSSKCDWSQPPYSTADANGWTDSKEKRKQMLATLNEESAKIKFTIANSSRLLVPGKSNIFVQF